MRYNVCRFKLVQQITKETTVNNQQKKLKDVERELERRLRAKLPDVTWDEFACTTCGDKQTLGRHVTVTFPSNEFETSVPKGAVEFVRDLFNELFDTVLEVKVDNRLVCSGCSPEKWREVTLVFEKLR